MDRLTESEIEELVLRKLEGESYSGIRSSLSGEGFSEEEVRSIIRQVDKKVLEAEIEQINRNRSNLWYRGGLAVAIVGLLFTIAFNGGWILLRLPRWIVYGPFFSGIVLMLYGRRLQQKQTGAGREESSRIRRKRPFK